MGMNKNKTVRCDWCGRLSSNVNGEYERSDKIAGYITTPERWGLHDDGRDICDDCGMKYAIARQEIPDVVEQESPNA